MGVLLIHPRQVRDVGLQEMAFVEPLAVERLAGAVRQADPVILDMRLDPDLAGVLDRVKPVVVGITCPFTTQVPEVLRVAEAVKHTCPAATVIVGGHHPTLMPEDFAVPQVDAIGVGEGELTFAEVVECALAGRDLAEVPGLILNRGGAQVRTAPRPPLQDLDALPLPARDLTAAARHRYYWTTQTPHAMVETARGCPHRCTFCSVWRFYGTKMRYLSPERIADEVQAIAEPYIFFTDDNFLFSVPRARRTAELIAQRGIRKHYTFQARTDTIARHPDLLRQWRDIGLVCVFLGLEKTSTAGLEELDKRNTIEQNEAAIALLKELGIGFTGNFIVDPQWTAEDFADLRRYVTERELFNSSFSILTPLPGTVLFEQVRDQIITDDYTRFDLWHSVLPTRLPPEEFYRQFASLWRAAAQALPRRQRRRRLWRALGKLLTGRGNLAHARRLHGALRRLADPATYLQHPPA